MDHELRRLCYDTEREMRIRLQLIQTNRDDEKEYDKLRGEIFYKHANKRVGAFIKSQQVTPKEKSQLIARLYEQQGLGLPWGRQFFRNPLSHSPNEGPSTSDINTLWDKYLSDVAQLPERRRFKELRKRLDYVKV